MLVRLEPGTHGAILLRMPRRAPVILITGFGPFPGVAENASACLAESLAALVGRRLPGHAVSSAVLDTRWSTLDRDLTRLYAATRPRLALHFGVSPRAEGFTIELQARNARADRVDVAGQPPATRRIVPGGVDRRPATLPADLIVTRLHALGLPARLSQDAGDYLCNELFYRALSLEPTRSAPTCIGFVHIPSSLAGAGPDGLDPLPGCPLTWAGALAGGLEIVRTCLGKPAARPRAPDAGGLLNLPRRLRLDQPQQ